MSPMTGTQCASPQHSGAAAGHTGREGPTDREGPQPTVNPQGCSFSGVSGGNPGQTRSHVNAFEGRDTVSHGPMNCSGTPGMGGPLAEGARTVPIRYVLPADCGNPSVVRSFEGDARTRQGYTGNVPLSPSFGGIVMGGNPQSQVLAAGNVAQFPGRNASRGYGSGEPEALLDRLQYVSYAPGLPLLEVLANMNLEDERWLPVLHRLALLALVASAIPVMPHAPS